MRMRYSAATERLVPRDAVSLCRRPSQGAMNERVMLWAIWRLDGVEQDTGAEGPPFSHACAAIRQESGATLVKVHTLTANLDRPRLGESFSALGEKHTAGAAQPARHT